MRVEGAKRKRECVLAHSGTTLCGDQKSAPQELPTRVTHKRERERECPTGSRFGLKLGREFLALRLTQRGPQGQGRLFNQDIEQGGLDFARDRDSVALCPSR